MITNPIAKELTNPSTQPRTTIVKDILISLFGFIGFILGTVSSISEIIRVFTWNYNNKSSINNYVEEFYHIIETLYIVLHILYISYIIYGWIKSKIRNFWKHNRSILIYHYFIADDICSKIQSRLIHVQFQSICS